MKKPFVHFGLWLKGLLKSWVFWLVFWAFFVFWIIITIFISLDVTFNQNGVAANIFTALFFVYIVLVILYFWKKKSRKFLNIFTKIFLGFLLSAFFTNPIEFIQDTQIQKTWENLDIALENYYQDYWDYPSSLNQIENKHREQKNFLWTIHKNWIQYQKDITGYILLCPNEIFDYKKWDVESKEWKYIDILDEE